MTRTRFTKGHGTRNDFVLLADTKGELDLTPELVRALADRRGGVGGDGVIRLVPTALVPESRDVLAEDPHAIWFMDYRNADGSVAEMCGNGVRVFAAFAERLGLVSFAGGTEVPVGTRAGVKRVRKEDDGWFAVDMGPWFLPGGRPALQDGYDATVVVRGWEVPRPALSVDLGNPHTVLAVAREDVLERADLTEAPVVEPHPSHGTNVELVVPLGETTADDGTVVGHVRMRVHERGVGETPSCGTGACAAALAVRVWGGPDAPDTYLVDVPGGTVRVRALPGGRVELAGPAVLVHAGEIDLAALVPGTPVPPEDDAHQGADGLVTAPPAEPVAAASEGDRAPVCPPAQRGAPPSRPRPPGARRARRPPAPGRGGGSASASQRWSESEPRLRCTTRCALAPGASRGSQCRSIPCRTSLPTLIGGFDHSAASATSSGTSSGRTARTLSSPSRCALRRTRSRARSLTSTAHTVASGASRAIVRATGPQPQPRSRTWAGPSSGRAARTSSSGGVVRRSTCVPRSRRPGEKTPEATSTSTSRPASRTEIVRRSAADAGRAVK